MNKKSIQYGLLALICAAIAFGVWKYRTPSVGAGDPVPDFQVTTMDGASIKLSDLRGKYVLLHFWGSWCGPCRKESPHLVELYRKYHEKGFEILSVAIDVNTRAWQTAIINDRMAWPYHAMEPYDFGGPVSKQFNIKSIPATFLINPQGVIMGVNLIPEYLDKMLAEKLGK
ncbi:MAG: TlpA family protein disulfide reductase [Saprospiraceae bacterium]|nr:TlpA family protein disulfide reductase [Saprospiraceae bacterium]